MPVSSPSYFPPQRGNFSIVGQTAGFNALGSRNFLAGQSAAQNTSVATGDLIVIGYQAFDAGTVPAPINQAGLAGTIVIGNTGASALLTNPQFTSQQPSIFIGTGVAPVLQASDANVIIGNGAVARYVGNSTDIQGALRTSVIIGTEALASLSPTLTLVPGLSDNVIIGRRACYGPGNQATIGTINTSVIIGSEANYLIGTVSPLHETPQANVIIGYRAGSQIDRLNGSGSVIIGSQAVGGQRECLNSVIIGNLASTGPFGGATFPRDNVVVGSFSFIGGARSTLVGGSIIGNSNRCIYLGFAAKNGIGDIDDLCAIGHDLGRLLYGEITNGNVILGNSTAGGTVLNFGTGAPTNVVKLLNGSVATSNPVGGGYFYVNAGALHWVGSAGTDTVIAPA